jgi:TRAP-type C4-dicarboxylate transport system substrate-binding protein
MPTSGTDRRVAWGLVLALSLTACAGSTDRAGGTKPVHPVVLRVLDTRGVEEVAPYADAVKGLSAGAVRLNIAEKVERNSVNAEPDAIQAVRAGRVDLAVVPARAFHAAGVNSFDALIAPFAIDSMAMQQRVLGSDIPGKMLAGVRSLGLVGLAVLPGPMRKPVGISRDLLGPATYRHAVIAESPSVVGDRSLRALGAAPVGSPFEGADMSRFDGLEQHVSSIYGNGYDETVRSITVNVNLWPRPLVVVADPSSIARLSSQQRQALRSAARTSLAASVAGALAEDTVAAAAMCRSGQVTWRTATATQQRDLRRGVAPVHSWLRHDSATARYLDAIAALRGAGPPDPLRAERLSCRGPAAPAAATDPPAARTPFDGTYRMVSTQQQAQAVDPNTPPENWGTFVYIFRRGRFAITQANAVACSWAYGTYTVRGHEITWSFVDGGGSRPDGAANKPGELFVFRWSRYRGAVTLAAVPGKISPDNFFGVAWHRLSSSAAPRYFSRRCRPPVSAIPR